MISPIAFHCVYCDHIAPVSFKYGRYLFCYFLCFLIQKSLFGVRKSEQLNQNVSTQYEAVNFSGSLLGNYLHFAYLRAFPAVLSVVLWKNISHIHPSLVIWFFRTLPIKLKLQLQIGARLPGNSKPPGNREHSQIIFYITLLWQVLGFAMLFTSLNKFCKHVRPKAFCWAKLACFDFSSSNFYFQGHILSTSAVAFKPIMTKDLLWSSVLLYSLVLLPYLLHLCDVFSSQQSIRQNAGHLKAEGQFNLLNCPIFPWAQLSFCWFSFDLGVCLLSAYRAEPGSCCLMNVCSDFLHWT